MGTFYILLWVLSTVGVVFLAAKYELEGVGRLVAINVLLPFMGFLYVAYVCFWVRPVAIAKANGQPHPYFHKIDTWLQHKRDELEKKLAEKRENDKHIK